MTLRITAEQILLNLQATSREEVLAELARSMHGRCPHIPWEKITERLLEREHQESTGHGNGIAIPHATLEQLEETTLLFGRTSRGIQFNASDNRPVHLFVAILVPQHADNAYLSTLAKVSRLLKQPQMRAELMQAPSADMIQEIFSRSA